MQVLAQTYKMPPDTNEEEKIVGGYIDKFQLIWLVVGAGIGAILTIIFFKIVGAGALFLLFPPLIAGCVFAFYKRDGIPLFTWLRLSKRYKKSTKMYVNYGGHRDICFMVPSEEGEN